MNEDIIDRIVSRWSDEYRRQAAPLISRLKELLGQGLSIQQAVNQAFDDTGFSGALADELKQSLGAAAGAGFGAKLPVEVQKTIGEKLSLLPWTSDKMPLSSRLHGTASAMRQSIVKTINDQMTAGTNWVQMSRKLYDGYGFPETIQRAELPQYLQSLVRAAQKASPNDPATVKEVKRLVKVANRNIGKLAQNDAPTRALKAAYKQLATIAEKGSAKALGNAIDVAINERSRYYAERIARTEISRAWSEGFWAKHSGDQDVVAVRWRLGSRHPAFDVCDFHAGADLYGMGRGVYPKGSNPPHPAHPHCTCRLTPVYDGEVDAPQERVGAGGSEYLKGLDDEQRQALLGIAGVKALKRGEAWQPYMQSWQGHANPVTRLVTTDFFAKAKKSDIINLRGDYSPAYEAKLIETATALKESGLIAKEHALNRIVGRIAQGRLSGLEDIIAATKSGQRYKTGNNTYSRYANGISVHFNTRGEILTVDARKKPAATWELISDE